MSDPVRIGECPFCNMLSHHPKDKEERYCARCGVFIDDVLTTSPSVRRAMIRFHRRLADRDPDKAPYHIKMIQIWGHNLP